MAQQNPPPSPYNSIEELKTNLNQSLQTSLTSLEKKSLQIQEYSDVETFFKNHSNYDVTVDSELDKIETQIQEVNESNATYEEYVNTCAQYVDKSVEIVNGIPAAIGIIEDELKTTKLKEIKEKLGEITSPLKNAIDQLISSSPSPPNYVDVLKEMNTKLNLFSNNDDDNFVDSLYNDIKKELNISDVALLFGDNMQTFISNTIPNEINSLLTKNKEKIIDFLNNLSEEYSKKINITTIQPLFYKFIEDLKAYFAENGGEDTLFKLLSDFFTVKFTELKTKTLKELTELGPVPVMPDKPDSLDIGGGNNSTFATYPVSRKSQKNRNMGNSKGKGKGKGKGKKLNATKKISRR